MARPLEPVKDSEGPFVIPLPRDAHRALSLNSIRLHMKLSAVEMTGDSKDVETPVKDEDATTDGLVF